MMKKVISILFSLFLVTAMNAAHWGQVESSEAVVAAFQVALQVPKDDTTPEEENKEAGPAPKEAVSSPEKGKSDPAVREKAPIKRDFVPSEKIPADQAVDFPADI